MPISEEGRQRQREALARAREARKAKQEAALSRVTGIANDAPDVMPKVELRSDVPPEAPKATEETPGVTKTRFTFVSLDDRTMEVCLKDKCWTGKEFFITEDDRAEVGASSLESLARELTRNLKTGGFIVSVR